MPRKAAPGDPFEPSASEWNRAQEAAEWVARHRNDRLRGPRPQPLPPGWVWITNTTANDLIRFGVLGIDAPTFTTAENLDDYKVTHALKGVSPRTGTHDHRIAIAQEPIKAGQTGRAVVVGITTAKIKLPAARSASDPPPAAAIKDNETGYLQAGTGPIRVLVCDAGAQNDIVWAKVALPPIAAYSPSFAGVLFDEIPNNATSDWQDITFVDDQPKTDDITINLGAGTITFAAGGKYEVNATLTCEGSGSYQVSPIYTYESRLTLNNSPIGNTPIPKGHCHSLWIGHTVEEWPQGPDTIALTSIIEVADGDVLRIQWKSPQYIGYLADGALTVHKVD